MTTAVLLYKYKRIPVRAQEIMFRSSSSGSQRQKTLEEHNKSGARLTLSLVVWRDPMKLNKKMSESFRDAETGKIKRYKKTSISLFHSQNIFLMLADEAPDIKNT